MKRISYALVFLGLLYFAFCPLSFAAPQDSSSLPIKVVVVSGSNYEMGVQYGEQAADLIAGNRDATWDLLNILGHDMVMDDLKVWTYYIEKYDPKLRDWLLGISDGCENKGFNVSYVDLVALMVLPQELWARPEEPYPAETGIIASTPSKSLKNLANGRTDTRALASCTAFAATGSATGGEPMISLTLGFIPEIKLYVIIFAYPDEGVPFVNLTMAGKVTNNTGMNSHFAWVMTAAVTHPMTPCASSWGVPSEAYHHYLQQYCMSPEDAMAYLDSTPVGGVTGIFLFADKSGEVFAYEVGSCESATRYPGDLNETDFVATTNNYNSPVMLPYAIPAAWFSDTYIRYATIYKKLSEAQMGGIGLDFAKSCWLSNDWYDEASDQWHTVLIPNDPMDYETCNVPGNNCEGGESQVVQFPAQKTVYLQAGGPHGTEIQYYWPDNPKPTGEYTKWQLETSIDKVAKVASMDTLKLLNSASTSLRNKMRFLPPNTKRSLNRLLADALKAWHRAEQITKSHHSQPKLSKKESKKTTSMAQWGSACTDYATAQLYSQMISTKLNCMFED
jgi:hypothetical protein